MNWRIVSVLSAAISLSMIQAVSAQEAVPERPDLSNPDVISRPPMDPYSLSYTPDKPESALNIISPETCQNAGGRWSSMAAVSPLDETVSLRLVGCLVKDTAEGRWMYSMNYGKNDKFYSEISEKSALGYVWMIGGKKTGWEVFLNAPEEFTRVLRHYVDGEFSGTSFVWNEMGALSEVKTYKDGGILDGKYEEYVECLPTVLGQYKDGKPVGKWDFFAEPGMINMRRDFDRKAQPSDLPPNAPEDMDARWTEWFNSDGVKIADGYSMFEVPEDTGRRVGDIQLYTTVGTPWMNIKYDKNGNINDGPTFELCMHEGVKTKPSYLDYEHEEVYINCNGEDGTTYRRVYFYRTGEVWKIVSMDDGRPVGRTVEYHPAKEPDSVYGEILAEYEIKSGVPEGTIEFRDRNGNLMGEPSVINHGTGHYKSWWFNGNPSEEGDYYHGNKTGHWKKWFDSGSLEQEIDYKNGMNHGTYKQWFNNGVLSIEVNYSNGIKNGDMNVYYTDGHIAYEYFYNNGSPSGLWHAYTHGGQVSSDTKYSAKNDGDESGNAEMKLYYSDGSLQASGRVFSGYIGDLKIGRWNYYLKDDKTKQGKIWYSLEYDNGDIVSAASTACSNIRGEYKIDAENREIGCTVCAVNREQPLQMYKMRENEWQWYSVNGTLEKKGSIHMGHMNGMWEYYYSNGKPMLSGSYSIDRKVGNWTGFYENGLKKFSGNYDNGVETGLWTTFHDVTETVSSEGLFVEGKRDGAWVWKYPNGQIREEGVFKDGKETGTWSSYYENGQKEGTGEYVNGLREGLWTWWRQDGKVWRTVNFAKGKEVLTKEK